MELTKEQADEIFRLRADDPPYLEKMARALCHLENVEPDFQAEAIGASGLPRLSRRPIMPKGYRYKLWEYRLHELRVALEARHEKD